MNGFAKPAFLGAVFLAGLSVPGLAADLYEPPVIETPIQREVIEVSTGGWYLRGDLDYASMKIRGVDYHAGGALNSFITAETDNTYSIGIGGGYKFNKYFRADLTADYEFKTDFRGSTSGDCSATGTEPGSCTSSDTAKYSILLLMANAYVDFGTYHGFTPYGGFGIGGAKVKWDNLTNVATCNATACNSSYPGGPGTTTTATHSGEASWRFAWSLMAGVSYDLTDSLKLDAGYRYTRIYGGPMFKYATACCGSPGTQGYDGGFNMHQVRLGLRYQFGGSQVARTEYVDQPVVYK